MARILPAGGDRPDPVASDPVIILPTGDHRSRLSEVDKLTDQKQVRRCPICGATFATRKPFEEHYREAHHRLSRVACPGCGAEFETRGEMIDHARRLHHRWS